MDLLFDVVEQKLHPISDGHRVLILARDTKHGSIVGTVELDRPGPHGATIQWLWTKPDARRAGVGTQLVEAACRIARQMGAWGVSCSVFEASECSSLLEKLQFVSIYREANGRARLAKLFLSDEAPVHSATPALQDS